MRKILILLITIFSCSPNERGVKLVLFHEQNKFELSEKEILQLRLTDRFLEIEVDSTIIKSLESTEFSFLDSLHVYFNGEFKCKGWFRSVFDASPNDFRPMLPIVADSTQKGKLYFWSNKINLYFHLYRQPFFKSEEFLRYINSFPIPYE